MCFQGLWDSTKLHFVFARTEKIIVAPGVYETSSGGTQVNRLTPWTSFQLRCIQTRGAKPHTCTCRPLLMFDTRVDNVALERAPG